MAKNFLRSVIWLIVPLTAVCNLASRAEEQAARPNIVWLTTEDNATWWYRLYNPDGAPMPEHRAVSQGGACLQ
jgi:hypothetical protein